MIQIDRRFSVNILTVKSATKRMASVGPKMITMKKLHPPELWSPASPLMISNTQIIAANIQGER